jgi:putative membrane protein
MNTPAPGSIPAILDALGSGLPMMLLHLIVTIALLAIGVRVYVAVTPFKERSLLMQGNVAAGTVLGGAVIALALPLAALLATSFTVLDLIVWGVVALVLQLLTLAAVAAVLRGFGGMIERGNVAAGIALAASQIAVALLNAAVMIPT